MSALEVTGGDGLLGVERIVSVLRQRGYRVRHLRVDWDDDTSPAWTLRCAVVGHDPDLLVARLERAVSVHDIRLVDSGAIR